MKIVAFLNPKVGVGCTSLVYHLAWMYSELGYRVVAVDADPQADLSGMFLGFDRARWLHHAEPGDRAPASLGHALQFGTNGAAGYTWAIASGLDFVASSGLYLEHIADDIGARLRRCLLAIAAARDADLILLDAGAGIGACAGRAAVSSDSLIIPTSGDAPSEEGLSALLVEHGRVLAHWSSFVASATDPAAPHADAPADRAWLGAGPSLLGYVLTGESHYAGFTFPNQGDRAPNPGEALEHLGTLRRHPSLRDLSLQARKPMFALTPADGALGSITVAVQRCRSEYADLARHVADRLGLAAPR